MNLPFSKKAASVLIAASLATSCASVNDFARDYGTAAGCIGGAALGGGITYLVTHDAKKALVGGLQVASRVAWSVMCGKTASRR